MSMIVRAVAYFAVFYACFGKPLWVIALLLLAIEIAIWLVWGRKRNSN